MNYPVTPAIRVLRENKIEYVPHVFEYVEKGGTKHSSAVLGVDEHAVIKTLVFETNEKKPLIVLMHGDWQVSAKNLARALNVKTVAPAAPEKVSKLTGYLVGGTSPFGVKTKMPVYAEKTIFDLKTIYINGGKRGFLVAIGPQALRDILPVVEVEAKQEKNVD
jgi:Cys-tRNA(Pro) deacylase